MKTLIVEDDFTARLTLQTFLSGYGECHIAVNGKEAVEAYRLAAAGGSRYDLICMDILLPEMDGQAAVREIRCLEEEQGVFPDGGAKIIMTTALSDMKNVMQSFKDLCDAYLVKPVNLRDLLNHLETFGLLEGEHCQPKTF